jgi:hypothetical protein
LLRTKKGKERNGRNVGNKNRLRQVANANGSRSEVDHKDVKDRMRKQMIFLKWSTNVKREENNMGGYKK